MQIFFYFEILGGWYPSLQCYHIGIWKTFLMIKTMGKSSSSILVDFPHLILYFIETLNVITTLAVSFILLSAMKRAFTLIEIVIVLLVIGILMAATMRFGSGRIVDLKAQSLKEDFVGYYNELYNQNMTSSYRDKIQYKNLIITFESGVWYQTDYNAIVLSSKLSDVVFRNFMLDIKQASNVQIHLVPYQLWCTFTSQDITGNIFLFQLYVPQNGKQYCFEIKSETCKLIETKCD